ncbi:MAG TPA: tetratricopeptide repeat protein, partial [Polyangiaceae bacterium]
MQPARAQETEPPVETTDPGDEYRDDARRLATEAATHYDAGEYELALDLFLRAGRLYDAPTLKFWQARCLEQMGRLVDAEARYAEVARTRVDDDAPEAFLSAQRDSEAALAELRKRLPTITIVIHQAKDISKVELDGRVLPPPLVGAPVAVDPGTHVIKVTRSSGPERVESVAIVESQAQVVHVNFDAPKQTPLVPIMTPAPDAPPSSFGWRTTVGVSSLILGTVGVGVGVFAGVKAMDKHRTLEENCDDDGNCPPRFHEEYDSFHKWKNIST